MIFCHLDQILKSRNIPYQELSAQIGLSYVALWKLANGKKYNPSLEVIEKICRALKCEVGELFSLKKNGRKS